MRCRWLKCPQGPAWYNPITQNVIPGYYSSKAYSKWIHCRKQKSEITLSCLKVQKKKRNLKLWKDIDIGGWRTFHERFNKCIQMSIKKDIELRFSLNSLLNIWFLQVQFLLRPGNTISKNIFSRSTKNLHQKFFLPVVTFALQLSGEHARSVDVVCVVHLMIMVARWWL